MYNLCRNKNGFVGIIELLLVLAIVSLIVYLAMNIYFKKTPADKTLQKDLAEQGINVSRPLSTIDTTRIKVNEANKKTEEMEKQARQLP